MKMKNILMATLATTITMAAALPAAASSYTSCKLVEAVASTSQLAHGCHDYIVGVGLITKGKHKNKQWLDAYPGINFRKVGDPKVSYKYGSDVHGDLHYVVPQKFIWKVNGKDSIETKELGLNDVDGYLNSVFKKNADVDGVNSGRQALHNLKHK